VVNHVIVVVKNEEFSHELFDFEDPLISKGVFKGSPGTPEPLLRNSCDSPRIPREPPRDPQGIAKGFSRDLKQNPKAPRLFKGAPREIQGIFRGVA